MRGSLRGRGGGGAVSAEGATEAAVAAMLAALPVALVAALHVPAPIALVPPWRRLRGGTRGDGGGDGGVHGGGFLTHSWRVSRRCVRRRKPSARRSPAGWRQTLRHRRGAASMHGRKTPSEGGREAPSEGGREAPSEGGRETPLQ